ncbi:MAG: hypothetical protein UZ22_OP11002001043 [Microgenomates bacterium OLB23]|nr:MAG: hypothetical protein UZ22_OP11002001043 [Microgenomates bacterium OLB23]
MCGYDDPTKGQLFTSGNTAVDKQFCMGEDTLDLMSKPPVVDLFGTPRARWEMQFAPGSSGQMTTADGTLNVTVKIMTAEVRNVSCFFVAQTTPSVVGKDDENVAAGSRDTDSLTYATFRTQGEPAACVSVRNDPSGAYLMLTALNQFPGQW